MSEHRVSVLSASLSRRPDPERSRDPRVQAVLAQLKTLPAPAPRAHFRAELRTQLVAVAPRLIALGTAAEAPMVDIVGGTSASKSAARHADGAGVLARLRGLRIGRPLAIATSVLAAFALLLGGAVLMSKKALPGDTLYGLKRASEQVELATASSDSEKAQDYLKFAANRVNEAQSLLARASTSAAGTGAQAAGVVNSHTASLITSTLSSSDSDVKSAAKLLGGQAVRSHSGKPLTTMTNWGPDQLRRLQKLVIAIPPGTLRTRANSSAQLVIAALYRAVTLQNSAGCSCLSHAASDELGPVPCTACATTGTGAPKGGGGSNPTTTPSKKVHASGTSSPTPGVIAPPVISPAPGVSTSPGLVLPTLPTLLPTSGSSSQPIDISSCGASVNIGPIHIGLGSCTTSPSP